MGDDQAVQAAEPVSEEAQTQCPKCNSLNVGTEIVGLAPATVKHYCHNCSWTWIVFIGVDVFEQNKYQLRGRE